MCESAKSDLFLLFCTLFRSLNHGIPKNSGRRVGCYVFNFLRIWPTVSFMRRSSFIEQPLLVLAPSSLTGTLFNFFFITRTLKQDDLAAAFSHTLLPELEQNYSSGLVIENIMSLFTEIAKYFNFVSIFFPPRKHQKRQADI